MGPTASGKTGIAVSLCKRFPMRIISVDSALVYRGMDIGTAKPDAETLRRAPHRLIDIRDPEEPYSAGEFVQDARREIEAVIDSGHMPLLVGGTMMYFRALTEGIADLPAANPEVRAAIDEEAGLSGWPAMHEKLRHIDPVVAARIKPNDRQRIQRALEVYLASGRPLSEWHAEADPAVDQVEFIKLGLRIPRRATLHERIEARLDMMFEQGFVDEVRTLMSRPALDRDAASMRAVGYRQVWAHLEGECSLEESRYRALVATRQLAKRQITWLRSETGVTWFDPLEASTIDAISGFLCDKIHKRLG